MTLQTTDNTRSFILSLVFTLLAIGIFIVIVLSKPTALSFGLLPLFAMGFAVAALCYSAIAKRVLQSRSVKALKILSIVLHTLAFCIAIPCTGMVIITLVMLL